MRLCIIARADLTGLGVQSRNWVRLLNPDKTIVINSTPFNGNKQHLDWYKRRNAFVIDGFIKQGDINPILDNIDVLLTFEIPYNYDLIRVARERGVKTVIQNNWEFTDYLRDASLPLPDLLVNHSYWHLDEQQQRWPLITEYCATPLFIEDYDSMMLQNLERAGTKRRFLHIAGRKTYEDRNGTQALLAAMRMVPRECDFELVIKAQNAEVQESNDPRITIDRSEPVDERELYRGFDAMIMPRRYGGACLPMTEALASGMPVIMTNIDPNSKILPESWLIPSIHAGTFMTRTEIDLYNADPNFLADKIVELATISEDNLKSHKVLAREIALHQYGSESVKEKWTLLMSKIGL